MKRCGGRQVRRMAEGRAGPLPAALRVTTLWCHCSRRAPAPSLSLAEKLAPVKERGRGLRVRASGFEVPDVDLWEDDEGDSDSVPLEDASETAGELLAGCNLVEVATTVLRITGEDRGTFLHNQSTASVQGIPPGRFFTSAFVTPQARLLDAATVVVQENSTLLLASPGSPVQERLDRYVLNDDVQIEDISGEVAVFVIFGRASGSVLRNARLKPEGESQEGTHSLLQFQGYPVVVLSDCRVLPGGGVTLVAHKQVARDVREALSDKCKQIGEGDYERVRIAQGLPSIGRELSQRFTPLEVGLFSCIDLDKGCCMGQEALQKVCNRDAVRRKMCGLAFDGGAGFLVESDAGNPARVYAHLDSGVEGSEERVVEAIGEVTSASNEHALAVLKCRAGGRPFNPVGMRVSVFAPGVTPEGEDLSSPHSLPAKVESLPLATFYESDKDAGAGLEEPEDSEGGEGEGDREERKMREMREKVQAWMRAQEGKAT